MKQLTLSAKGFERYGKTTRRAVSCGYGAIVPWADCARWSSRFIRSRAMAGRRLARADVAGVLSAAVVQPVGSGGRGSAVRLGRDAQLRRHRSGGGSGARRDDGVQVPPSAGEAQAGEEAADDGERALERSGIKIATGTIVDATIIGAPSSTKNKDGKRDPEMHQTAKGKQWYFGMKAHIGVDSRRS